MDDVSQKVDLNQSSKVELMDGLGITDVQAEAVLAFRELNGRFESIRELHYLDSFTKAQIIQLADRIRL